MLVDDGQAPDQPIGQVRALRGARVLTRHELAPATWDWTANLGDVELWRVNVGGRSLLVHADRMVILTGIDLPDDVMMANGGWPGSIFDLVWASLRNYGASLDYVPEFISLTTQGVFKQRGLATGVLAGRAAEIAARYETLVGGLSVLNALALDADGEDYQVLQRPATGMRELFDVLIQGLQADGDMPRLLLLGETPGGLHAGSDAPEIRAWYDHCSAQQETDYTPPLARMLRILARSSEGPTAGRPVDATPCWLPLYQQTISEEIADEGARAARRATDVNAGIVSAAEARREPEVRRLYQLTDADLEPTAGPSQGDQDLPEDPESQLVAAPQSMIPAGETLISAQHAATLLGVTAQTVHRMAASGKFPAFRVGSRWRYAWSTIAAHVSGEAH